MKVELLDIDTAAVEAADPLVVDLTRPLSAEEQKAADEFLDAMLTETEVQLWNARVKFGEHQKGHLTNDILPFALEPLKNMLRDFYEQAEAPVVPPGTNIGMTLTVKEAFLVGLNDHIERSPLEVIEQVAENESIFDAFERCYGRIQNMAMMEEPMLEDGRTYKASIFIAWTWPKKIGRA